MKILFFTPAVLTSAIGRVSKLVVAELLQQGHDVAVVRAEDQGLFESPIHPFSCQMLLWNSADQVRASIEQSELIVYQVGDFYPYHRGCLEWLISTPGLVLLHDNFLAGLFWSWSERIGRAQALNQLSTLYGPEVAHKFFDHSDSTSFIAYNSQAAPMTEWISSMASAVIVHSRGAMDRITRACPGPVEVVPLPYDSPFLEAEELPKQSTGGERVVVLTIGHVNPNKRYSSVINAIGSSPVLRQNLTYRIVGLVEPVMAKDLASLAGSLGVDLIVTGEVDDRRLAAEIHQADVMCCLRWPALEAASASTIEAMLYGKPTVVMDTGFYRDLPDDCVFKISPEAELAELRVVLEKLVASPTERTMIGRLARHYAAKTFRADNYAKRITAMKRRIDQSKIVSASAEVFSNSLRRWGVRGDAAIIEATVRGLRLFR